MKDEHSIRPTGMGAVFSIFIGIYAIKALRRSVSYGSLTRKFAKNDNQDISFRLLTEDEAVLETNTNYDSDAHRFTVNNGIGASATIVLQPGEVAQSERGAMLAKGAGIEMETAAAANSPSGKVKGLIGRLASGESLLGIRYSNTSQQPQTLMLTPEDSKQLTAINLDRWISIFCDNGAFFASSAPVDLALKPIKNLSFQTFSGQGFTFQQITGRADGTSVLLASNGQVTPYKLAKGESLDIQKGSLFALTGNVTLGLKETSGAFNRIASGEHGFMTTVTGPGTVWIIAHSAHSKKRKEKSSLFDFLKPGD